MNKEAFLKKLRKRLNVLEDSEIEDIVSEYEGYIDEKVSLGLTEEEAVKELGDFEEIVNDLLSAYKLKGNNEENYFNNIFNKIGNFIDKFMDSLNDKSGRDIIRILIEIILILFLICILKIPIAMIRDLGADIFEELVRPIGYVFASIWTFIIEISYLVVAIIVFIKMVQKRCFKELSENITTIREDEESHEKEAKKKPKPETSKNIENKKEVIKEKRTSHGIGNILTDICIYTLKFIVLMILIGVVFYLIGMSVAIGFSVYLLINGVHYFGIFLLIIVLFLGGALILELCVNFVFNRRTKALPFFAKLITIIVLTGISLTMSAVEITATEIIYGSSSEKTNSITKEIEMTKDLSLYNYNKVIIDNNLKDKIVVEYIYPNFNGDTEMEIVLDKHGKGFYLSTNVIHARWNKKYIDKIIENLKDKKLYAYDFHLEKVIHISEENYKTIEDNNYKNYYEDYPDIMETITETYDVLNITNSNDINYMYLTLREFQDEAVKTVKVPKSISKIISEQGLYEFTFEYTNIFPNNIEQIFKKCKIINIEKVTNEE